MNTFLKNYTKETIIVSLIIGVTVIVYYPVRFFDFVFIDDHLYITGNQHIQKGLTWDALKWAFFTIRSGSWHPLTWISHMVDVSWYHLDAGGHHWTNLQIHLLSAVFLFIFLRKATKTIWQSAAITACFALHPLHVESVAWISERKDVLSICLAHLTLLSYFWYTENPSTFRKTTVLLCFILSLMSKPMMVTLPFLLCIIDYWPLNRWNKSMIWPLIYEKLSLFILAFTFAGFTYFSQYFEHAINNELALKYRILNAGIVYVQYLYKTFIPLNLSFFYPHPWERVSVIWGICCLGFIGGLFIFALKSRIKRPYIFTGVVWYLFTLIPVIGIVQIGAQQMADRYTYFPMTGIAIVVFFGIRYDKIIPVALCVSIIGCAIMARQQVNSWRNSYTLSARALANTSDNNYVAHYGLGEYYVDNEDYLKAIKHYKKTLNISPGYYRVMFRLAYALEKNQDYKDAIAQYQKYIKHKPLNASAHGNLANIYSVHTDQLTQAQNHYRIVLSLMPESPVVLTNYANFMIIQNKPKAALDYYIQAIDADPSYLKAYVNLSQLLLMEKEKSDDILTECINQICGYNNADLYFSRLSQTFIARKENQLATFFKEKTHECEQKEHRKSGML
jgi:Tfp pilus assembly protein PilF